MMEPSDEIRLEIRKMLRENGGRISDSEWLDLEAWADMHQISHNFLEATLKQEILRHTHRRQVKSRVDPLRQFLAHQCTTGLHIRLHAYEEEVGASTDELVFIENNNFLLIRHNRAILRPFDILRPRFFPWNYGSSVQFSVLRSSNPLIKEKRPFVYKTGDLRKIELIKPDFT